MLAKIRLFGGAIATILFIGGAGIPAQAQVFDWDNGLHFTSSNEDFKFRLNGRLQLQELIQKIDGARQTPAGATGQTATPSDFSNTFWIRRALISPTITLYDKLTITSPTVFATPKEPGKYRILVTPTLSYALAPEFNISGGVVAVPFDRPASSSWLLGVEPPITATKLSDGIKGLTIERASFGTGEDLGITIEGDIGSRFSYGVGVVNGSGYDSFNTNNELAWGGRVAFHLLDPVPAKDTDFEWSEKPKLTFGLATAYEGDDANDSFFTARRRLWSWQVTSDVAYRYHGFSINAALYNRWLGLDGTTTEDTNRDRKLTDFGYTASVGYFVVPKKLELMLVASQILREGPDNNANEFGGGVNWYIKDNNIKLQADYTNVLDYDDVPGLNNATYHKVRVMFSVMF